MKIHFPLVNLLMLLLFSLPLGATTIVDYTHYPLEAAQSVPPTILILMDNSRFMLQQAYRGDFNPHATYDGYFDPSASYSYSADHYFEMSTGGKWNGNFLNWLAMRRVDIVRKVLIGGKAVENSRTGNGSQILMGEDDIEQGYEFVKRSELGAGVYYPPREELGLTPSSPLSFGMDDGIVYVGDSDDPFSHATRWFAIKVKKESAKEPDKFMDGELAGVVQRMAAKARFGVETFNPDGEGGKVIMSAGGGLQDLIAAIESSGTTPWSPLAEAFFEGVRYFMQITPYYPHSPADYGNGKNSDPFYFQELSQYLPCTKSFIILISGSESTHDQNIPSSPPGGYTGNLRDYDGDAGDLVTSPEGGSDYLDDIALWAHTSDVRTGDQELQGNQQITLFTISALGGDSQLLKDAAKNGGFIDVNGNNLPDLDQEWDSDGNRVPDHYLEAQDGFLLEEKLLQAVATIFKTVASGSGVTIAANPLQDETTLFQAFFKSSLDQERAETQWRGFLHALWVDAFGNLREDSDGDKALVYTQDNIIKFTMDENTQETRAGVFSDADGDGHPDQNGPLRVIPLEQIHPLWEAGKKLALKDEREREIQTFVDSDGDGVVDAGECIDFIPDNALLLRPYLRARDEKEARDIINHIRGREIQGFRERTVVVNGIAQVWKLGDVIHSTPALSSHPGENYHLIYGDESYETFFKKWKGRPLTIFVGANDGMLHAFGGGVYHPGDNPSTSDKEEHGWYGAELHAGSGSVGDERWAYIPYNLLPHLKWLTGKDYTHVDYVDLKPKVTDARIFTDSAGNPLDNNHPEGWGTVVIGGMGMGGGGISVTDDFGAGRETRSFSSAYFALDITVPGHPRLLWEFTHPALGFTTSSPAIVRVESRAGRDRPEDDRWFVVCGSGPTDYQGNSTQPAHLFVVDLKTGNLVQEFEGNKAPGFMTGPLSIDADLDFNTEVIYIGESYCSEGGWGGSVYRLSTKVCEEEECKDPRVWSYATNPRHWIFSTFFHSPQPVTANLNASLDEGLSLWVYFGTGRYYHFLDRLDSGIPHYFFGIKDSCYRGGCSKEVVLSELYDSSRVVIHQGGTVSGASQVGWNEFCAEVQRRKGWYSNFFLRGERLIAEPSLMGGMLFFTTFTPDDDICSTDGISSLYTLYYQTGTAWRKSVELVKRQGSYGDDDTLSDNSQAQESIRVKTPFARGISLTPVIHLGKTVTILSSDSNSMIEALSVKPAFSVRSGMESWREE